MADTSPVPLAPDVLFAQMYGERRRMAHGRCLFLSLGLR
jgi:hypothetical protein